MNAHDLHVLVVERWSANQHFKQQDTQRPPVHLFRMSFALDNLWCKVLGGSAESQCHSALAHVGLGETEVSEANVAGRVQQNVFGLEVAVDDVVVVQVTEACNRSQKISCFFREIGKTPSTALESRSSAHVPRAISAA